MQFQLTALATHAPDNVVHPWAVYLEERVPIGVHHDVVSPIPGRNRFTVEGGDHPKRANVPGTHHHVHASSLVCDTDVVLKAIRSPAMGHALLVNAPSSMEVKLPTNVIAGVIERGRLAAGNLLFVPQIDASIPSCASVNLSRRLIRSRLYFVGDLNAADGDVRNVVASLFQVATNVQLRLRVGTLSDVVVAHLAILVDEELVGPVAV